MTVRVIASELCSATHLLSVSRMRSRPIIELLHKDPQWPLRVGLQFTLKWNGINHTSKGSGQAKACRCFRRVCQAWHLTSEVKVLVPGIRRAEG